MTTGTYYYGTGRRKTSVARVRIYNKPGSVSVNGKPAEDIFTVEAWKNEALKPLSVVGLDSKVTIVADIKVCSSEGGASGSTSSHHAIRSGIVRPYAPTGHRHEAEIEQEREGSRRRSRRR